MKKIAILSILTLSTFLTKAQSFDTTGIGNWPVLTNSYNTWLEGAFEANRDYNNAYDFGWGTYDVSTHFISGDSIYILKTVAGNYKAISIDQYASGIYNVTYSDLDKSNKVTKTFDKTPYDTKNFFYYSIDNDVVKDLEPKTEDWDIVFTKYLTIFPGFGAYPVGGVLSNQDVIVSEVHFAQGGSYSVNDTTTFKLSDDISTVGYDWKDAFAGIVYDTVVYYIQDQNGNVNELKFYKYGGSATGDYAFTVNGVKDSIIIGAGNKDQVYYSLQSASEVAGNQDHDWDIALYAPASFSSRPVRINDVNGAELYVYPTADISYWNVVSLEEQKVDVLSIYPNPTNDMVNIALRVDLPRQLTVSIKDLSGRTVKSEVIDAFAGVSEAQVSLDQLAPGQYLISMSGEGFIASSRLVVTP